MPSYEYKVIPAPKRGLKAKGVKGSEAQFANALATAMNDLGADGWEYVRADTLPCEERSGLTGKTTVFQNMLVFRRTLTEDVDLPAPIATVEDVAEPQPEPEAVEDDFDAMDEIETSANTAVEPPVEPAPEPRHAAE